VSRKVDTGHWVGRTIYTAEHRKVVALLRTIRQEAGLRQVDVAERLGRPQSFVSKYESGQRRLDLIELRAICQALGTSLPKFVRRLQGQRRRD
jgi:transcriptional regulator with XRE-family HTH domain